MKSNWKQKIESWLSAWMGVVARRHKAIILFTCAGMVWGLVYAINHLSMNTDTKDMLSPELRWRQLDAEIDKEFPQFIGTLLIVIEGNTPDAAADAAALLYQRLAQEKTLFSSVYYPAGSEYFRKSALLYLDTNELQDLADQVSSIQPFLGRLTEDQSLRGLFNMLDDAVQARRKGEKFDLTPISNGLSEAFTALDNNRHYTLSWQSLMGGEKLDKKIYREFIILQPIQDFDNMFPAQTALQKIRSVASELQLPQHDIHVRLTGTIALAHEELLSVMEGAELETIASFILVTLILFAGMRSVWLTVATLIITVAGLIFSAWFAAVTVGTLNIISVAFAIFYIGLGVDYAIYYSLRYRELRQRGLDNSAAIMATTLDTWLPLTLCGATTLIGFYAYIPTDYRGVAELGWITGSGMLISLLLTYTFLPALFILFPIKTGKLQPKSNPIIARIRDIPIRHARIIRILTVVMVIAALIPLPRLRFDHNTLNMQSKKNESVKTYMDLLADSDSSPWTSTVLAHNPQEAEQLAQKLEKLPLVKKVVWLKDMVPEQQDEKLAIIQDLDLLLGSLSIAVSPSSAKDSDNLSALQTFNTRLQELAHEGKSTPDLDRLHGITSHFLEKTQALAEPARHAVLERLQQSLLTSFPGRLHTLLLAMNAAKVTRESLPPDVRERWVNGNNYRLEIYARDNLMDNNALRNFVEQTETAVPEVSGSPVTAIEASNVVVKSFRQAILYAFVATCLLLLFLTEKKIDMVYIIAPYVLAALFTVALCVVTGIDFNFANIIALPLLLGTGLDGGINIIHRMRHATPEDKDVLASSSTLGIVLCTLSTMASFGNLALSPHLGTASMGKLLSIGLVMILFCQLVILPSLLARQLKR